MKKNLVCPVITVIALVLLLAIFGYFYFQLNRLDKKLTSLQETTASDTAKISAVINFFNSNLNAQNNQ